HVYSFAPARRFSFRLRSGEQQAPIVFHRPGVVVVGCNIHDWMVGYVHIADAAYTRTTGADGTARFTLDDGEWQVGVWHPGMTGAAVLRNARVNGAAALEIRLDEPLRERGPQLPPADSGYGL